MFNSWVRKIPWRRDRLPTPVFTGFPGGSDGKESNCNAGDPGSISGLGRSPGGAHGNPLQYFCLENPMDRGAWWAIAHRVTELDMTEWLSTAQHRIKEVYSKRHQDIKPSNLTCLGTESLVRLALPPRSTEPTEPSAEQTATWPLLRVVPSATGR